MNEKKKGRENTQEARGAVLESAFVGEAGAEAVAVDAAVPANDHKSRSSIWLGRM